MSGSLLLDVSRVTLRVLELQLGAGLAWNGEPGLGYRIGIGTGRGAFSFGLRLSGAVTTETAPVTLGFGADASF